VNWKSLLVLALAAGPANAEETPIVFLAGAYDLGYAQTACERVLSKDSGSAAASECRSFPDPHSLGRALETKVISALAAEPRCQGVRVLRDPHPSEHDDAVVLQDNVALKDKTPYWSLQLDAEPGSKLFGWTLSAHKAGVDSPVETIVNGAGTAEQSATQICIDVKASTAEVHRP
jgi:hypothetical protein